MGNTAPAPAEGMQIMLVLYGTASVQVQEEFRDIEAGDVIVVRPGATVSFRHGHALQLIVCSFLPSRVRMGLARSLDERALSVLLSGHLAQFFTIAPERFRSLAALLGASTEGGAMGNLGRLLVLLEAIVEAGRPSPGRMHPAVLRTIDAFDSDMARDWTLPELSESLDLDPSYLARIFKLSVGVPPIGYLAMLRAEAAAELLARTDLPCSKVGDRVGWLDANYFSRRFRQHFGESPSSYRERVGC